MITLTTKNGYPFQIDDEDKEIVDNLVWYRHKHGNTYYVIALIYDGKDKICRSMYLHRLLLNAPKGLVVHHKDGNGWNNCRSNIELMTSKEHAKTIDNRGFAENKTWAERVKINCGFCGKEFELVKGVYDYRLGKSSTGKLFCSPSCNSKMIWKNKNNKVVG